MVRQLALFTALAWIIPPPFRVLVVWGAARQWLPGAARVAVFFVALMALFSDVNRATPDDAVYPTKIKFVLVWVVMAEVLTSFY